MWDSSPVELHLERTIETLGLGLIIADMKKAAIKAASGTLWMSSWIQFPLDPVDGGYSAIS